MSGDRGSDDLLRVVDEVDWMAYAMPPSEQWYRPEDVPAAFRVLAAVSSLKEGRSAYDEMLFAVGNNHAGCLYPAAAAAAPFLVRIVRESQGWARWSALEILIECLLFDVDREEFVDPSGSVVRTKDAIVAAVRGIRADLEQLTREQVAIPTANSAQDLLEQLDRLATSQ